jgi:hypothetical protein
MPGTWNTFMARSTAASMLFSVDWLALMAELPDISPNARKNRR